MDIEAGEGRPSRAGVLATDATYSIIDDSNLPKPPGLTFVASGDMFVWPPPTGQGLPADEKQDEQIILKPGSAADSLTIEFNYDALSCDGETAMLAIDGVAYSAVRPCTAGTLIGNVPGDTVNTGYMRSTFVFDLSGGSALLEGALPSGWAAVAVGEPAQTLSLSAIAAMLGGFAWLAGGARRRGAS